MFKSALSKSIVAALTLTAALGLAPALAAPAMLSDGVFISDSDGNQSYPALLTESAWMTLRVPLASLGGSLPSNLTLEASGLPAGTGIALIGSERDGGYALLTVSVTRDNANSYVNASSQITLSSDGQALTSLTVPVVGTAFVGN
ncbi:hypothetical protein [Deinococcus sp.]|uniref:hypothetical protein n=1 Tax=Deinococcus sp. TaxID=47478 RepID=UPI003B599A93